METITKKWKSSERIKDVFILGVIYVAAILFLLLNSFATSPLFGAAYSGDAAMFLTIGKYWAKGTLPYVGLWDSKGPIIFGINALGYLLLDSKYGVFLIQILCLLVATTIIFKIFQKKGNRIIALCGTCVVLWIMLTDYAGDGTEEFALPLLCASFYLMYDWTLQKVEKGKSQHAPAAAFLYGSVFSFCFLTRLTNAVGVCAGVLVITITLLLNKEYKNLIKNAVAFLLGVAIVILPFVIYFQSKGILYDAFYGTFLYNLDYAGKSDMGLSTMSFGYMCQMIAGYSGAIFLMVTGLIEILFIKERRTSGAMWAAIGAVTTAWLFRSYGFLHYGLIALPYFPIAMTELWSLKPAKRELKAVCKILVCGFVFLGILGSVKTFRGQSWEHSVLRNREQYENQQPDEKILAAIPEEDKGSFVAYNTASDIYLRTEIKPCYPFFTMQDWAASQSESLTKMVINTYKNGSAKWILVSGDPKETLIYETLESRYYVEKTEENYTLYHLK